MKSKLDERGIDLDEEFNMLSMLSSDFHEIFAFLSYNRVSEILETGSVMNVFEEFLAESQDKYLDLNDTQTYYATKGLNKITNALGSRDMDYLKQRLKMKGIKI